MHLLCLILLLTGTAHAQRFPIQAGTGIRGFSGDGGPAAVAQLAVPSAVFVDIDGNITIADTSNDRVRVIAPDGTIRTIAGIGERLSSGDGGPASAAALSSPTALFVDGGGNIYVAEWTGHRVRTITPTGVITTVVGVGEHGFLGDGGLASESNIWSPTALYIDGAKNTYIAEWGNHRIREISPDGLVSSLAGTGLPGFTGDGGPANGSRINSPNGLFVDDTGAVFFSDLGNQRIRRIDPSGIIRTVAGTGDGGPATEAGISNPSGLFIDGPGNLFFVDAGNDRIRRVNKDGIIETVAGGSTSANGPPCSPRTCGLKVRPRSLSTSRVTCISLRDRVTECEEFQALQNRPCSPAHSPRPPTLMGMPSSAFRISCSSSNTSADQPITLVLTTDSTYWKTAASPFQTF